MERSSLETLFGALERAGARYLVAGGLAVLAHGYLRMTLDVDLVLDLEPPFEFEPAYRRRHRATIAPGVDASFVALEDLLAMKRAAGRPQDLADIDRLEKLRRLEQDLP